MVVREEAVPDESARTVLIGKMRASVRLKANVTRVKLVQRGPCTSGKIRIGSRREHRMFRFPSFVTQSAQIFVPSMILREQVS